MSIGNIASTDYRSLITGKDLSLTSLIDTAPIHSYPAVCERMDRLVELYDGESPSEEMSDLRKELAHSH